MTSGNPGNTHDQASWGEVSPKPGMTPGSCGCIPRGLRLPCHLAFGLSFPLCCLWLLCWASCRQCFLAVNWGGRGENNSQMTLLPGYSSLLGVAQTLYSLQF